MKLYLKPGMKKTFNGAMFCEIHWELLNSLRPLNVCVMEEKQEEMKKCTLII